MENQSGDLNQKMSMKIFHGEEIKDVKGRLRVKAAYRVSRRELQRSRDSECVKTGGVRWGSGGVGSQASGGGGEEGVR